MRHGVEQFLPVFERKLLVERAGVDRLAQKLGGIALKIGLDMAVSLRLTSECLARMQQRVAIDLYERLELDAEFLAIAKHCMVVIGNAPGTGVDVKPRVEAAFLRCAAEFGIHVVAANRPAAATGFGVVFKNLDRITRCAQFIRRSHTRKTRAENQHPGPPGRVAQLGRAFVIGLCRKAQCRHRLVHRNRARSLAYGKKKLPFGKLGRHLHHFGALSVPGSIRRCCDGPIS